MDLLSVGLGGLAPVFLGRGLLSLLGLRWRDDRWAWWGWVWVAGALGTAALLLAWLALGGPPDERALVPVAVAAVLLTWWSARRPRSEAQPAAPATWSGAAWSLLVLVMLLWGAAVLGAGSSRALALGDDASLWAFKARLLHGGGGLGAGFAEQVEAVQQSRGAIEPLNAWLRQREAAGLGTGTAVPWHALGPRHHLDYPLLNPLLQLWTFCAAERRLVWQNRLPIQLGGVALLLILAGALRSACGGPVAALLLLAVASLALTRQALGLAYSDGLVAAGLLLGWDGLRRFERDGRRAWLALAALGFTLAAWSKHEGALDLLALVVAALVLRAGWLARAWAWIVLPAAALGVTWLVNRVFGLGNDLLAAGALDLSRLPALGRFLWSTLLLPPWSAGAGGADAVGANGLFLLAACVVLVDGAWRGPWRRDSFLAVAALALAASLALRLLAYLVTPHDLDWHLQTSGLRVSSQLLPATALWLAHWWGTRGRPTWARCA